MEPSPAVCEQDSLLYGVPTRPTSTTQQAVEKRTAAGFLENVHTAPAALTKKPTPINWKRNPVRASPATATASSPTARRPPATRAAGCIQAATTTGSGVGTGSWISPSVDSLPALTLPASTSSVVASTGAALVPENHPSSAAAPTVAARAARKASHADSMPILRTPPIYVRGDDATPAVIPHQSARNPQMKGMKFLIASMWRSRAANATVARMKEMTPAATR